MCWSGAKKSGSKREKERGKMKTGERHVRGTERQKGELKQGRE